MKFSSSKTTATLVALFLMFAIAVSLVALPAATAQTVLAGKKKTYAYIGATPNPIGVGQEVLLHVGITDQTAHPQEGWEDLTVTITRPDDTTETLGPFKTDNTGGTGTIYVPTMTGDYTLQTHFPEQLVTAAAPGRGWAIGTVMEASDSPKLTLVVRDEQREYWPGVTLPTEYWTRPIDAQLREWSSISGSWLEAVVPRYGAQEAPYNDGPETGHILWKKKLDSGGLVGGEFGPTGSFEHGDAYEGKWYGATILAGILYYNRYPIQQRLSALGQTQLLEEVVAVDLHTGEELWTLTLGNNERLAFGQLMYWDTMNMHGAFPYLWTTVGSTWNAYDPVSGRWVYTMTHVPSAAANLNLRGSRGEILRYTVDLRNGWMTQWNSTSVLYKTYLDLYLNDPDPETVASAYYWGGRWRPQGITFDSNKPFNVSAQWQPMWDDSANTVGIDWNVTIPKGLPGAVRLVLEDRIIGTNFIRDREPSYDYENAVIWGISTAPGREGQLLFNETWHPPSGYLSLTVANKGASLEDGVFTVFSKETMEHFAFSLETGKYLWKTEPQPYLDFLDVQLGSAPFINVAYGKLFSVGSAGVVHAYDIKTGELLWTYDVVDKYTEILWGDNWPMRIIFITDEKVYLVHYEHSAVGPRPRGSPMLCLNATTGEKIWDMYFRSTWWGEKPIIGDSIIAGLNTYDSQVYAIGKGPSATTATASPKVSMHGDTILVEGRVTDVSPGTNSDALEMRFPNGVPAVSDANMSNWMQYVYMQFPRPTDVTGVEVVVDVLDPNNNYYEVGRAIGDEDGFFSVAFTPEVPGKYTIIASFEGSEAYYGSFAETAVSVEEAPAATPEPTSPPASAADLYFLPLSVGMIVAIVIVLALLVLILRRR